MKNPAPFIRESLVTLLNGTITYNAVPVPCYEGEGEKTPYQINLVELSRSGRDFRDAFHGQYEQVIEIVSMQATNMNKHVDAIGGEVMQLIKPTPKTTGIPSGSDFVVGAVKVISTNYLDEEADDGQHINRLILRISFLITEK